MPLSLQARFASLLAASPAERLVLRAGTMRDYKTLAAFHYRAHAPVTATRVLVLEDPKPGRVVAVLVESYPVLACSLRDAATRGRYRGYDDRAMAADLLNAEVRCISRVVVHPQWRGLGLAVRLVRRALATMTTCCTESLAAMGHVHPFFERAGMTAYHRPPHRRDQRLLDALDRCGVEPWELASASRIQRHMDPPAPHAAFLRNELARWAGRGSDLQSQLKRAREKRLCEPVYYIKVQESKGPTSKGPMKND